MPALVNFIEKVDLKDYTLIIPSVSVGNVPQLTVDVIISTYNLKKIATLWHPGIIPTVGGGNPFTGNEDICTACELFIGEELKLAAIQLRSAIDKKYSSKFFEELRKELATFNLKTIVILTSSFAHEMHDVQASKFCHVSNDSENKFNKLTNNKPEEDLMVPGGGFGMKLYKLLKQDFKVTMLVKYASEGDNAPDAIEMMSVLRKAYELSNDVRYPASWQHVYGNPPPIGLY